MNERRPIYGGGYGGGYGGFGGYPGYGFGGYGGFGGYPGYGFGGGYGYPGYGFGGYGGYGGFGDIRDTVLAAMAEATAATRSIIIIIGKANISDHSGKSTLGTAGVFFCDRF